MDDQASNSLRVKESNQIRVREFGVDVLCLQVGPEPHDELIILDKSKVRRKGLFTDDIIDGGRLVKLPDDDPRVFRRLLNWIETGRLVPYDQEDLSVAETDKFINESQKNAILELISKITESDQGADFAKPVADAWPDFAKEYEEDIAHPIDLGTIRDKVSSGDYSSFEAIKKDVKLLRDNCIEFNGFGSEYTENALWIYDQITAALPRIRLLAIPATHGAQLVPNNDHDTAPFIGDLTAAENDLEYRSAIELVALAEKYSLTKLIEVGMKELVALATENDILPGKPPLS